MIRIKVHQRFDAFGAAADAILAGCATESDCAALRLFSDRYGVEIVAETLARRGGPDGHGPGARWWRCNLRLLVPQKIRETAEICGELAVLEATGRGTRFDLSRHVLEVSGAVHALEGYLARLRSNEATDAERAAALMVVHCVRVARCAERNEVGG